MPRYYTEEHEWIDVDGDVATVGITDFAGQWPRFQQHFVARGVGGAEQHLALPRDDEEHAAVAGFGDQQRCVAGQEIPVDDEVRALATRPFG